MMAGARWLPAGVGLVILALSVPGSQMTQAEGQISVLPVQGRVHLLAGAGGNITVQIGDQGVLVVDSGSEGMNEKVLAAIRALSPKPIHYIVNTSADADHTGGNAAVAKAGRPVPGAGQGLGENVASIIAHEEVLNRLTAPSGQQASAPDDAWPTTTFFTPKKTIWFNDDPIEIIWQKAAHTDGDVFVFFRGSDVVSAGDVFSTTSYPVIDIARGGSIQGEIDALNRLIDITIPRFNQMGGTRVIPGHGRICNEADVVEYRDMVTIVRDRVRDLIHKGQTLEQVQGSKPTYEYDPMYGSTDSWTPNMFVEAVYRSLTAKPGGK